MAYIVGLADSNEVTALKAAGYELDDSPLKHDLDQKEPGEGLEAVVVWVDSDVTELLLPALCLYCKTPMTSSKSPVREATIHICPQCGAKVVIVRGKV